MPTTCTIFSIIYMGLVKWLSGKCKWAISKLTSKKKLCIGLDDQMCKCV